MVAVKAIACELPVRLGLPFSRLHVPDLQAAMIRRGLVASISDMTIWRWLDKDAIKPWTHRSWIFPRATDFESKAARVLDRYGREFEGRALTPDEFVLAANEKTSIQRLQEAQPNLVPVHLPIHASWLNQIEIYFAILQRKVLTPPDVNSLDQLATNILACQARHETLAKLFEWKFNPDRPGQAA